MQETLWSHYREKKMNKLDAEQDALLEKKLSAYCLLIVTKDAYLA